MEPSPAQGKCINTAYGPTGVTLPFSQLPCISVAMCRPKCLTGGAHIGTLNIHLVVPPTLRILKVGVLMSAWG